MKKILDFLRDFLPPLMCPGGSILPLKIYFIYLSGWGLIVTPIKFLVRDPNHHKIINIIIYFHSYNRPPPPQGGGEDPPPHNLLIRFLVGGRGKVNNLLSFCSDKNFLNDCFQRFCDNHTE